MFGYAKRVRDSFIGVFFGILLLPGSIILHAWNEYRTVHREKGLTEARKIVERIPDASSVTTSLDQKLVSLTGKAVTDEVLRDDLFAIVRPAIRLARRVEMYQWVEKKTSSGNNQNNSVKYEYKTEWEDDSIRSENFHNSSGHENPPMTLQSSITSATIVQIGQYQLNEALRDDMNNWKEIAIEPEVILESKPAEERTRYAFANNAIYFGVQTPEPSRPKVGDYRIRFEEVLPTEVSLIAKQTGNTFSEFRTSNGEIIQRLYVGSLTSDQIVDRLQTENTIFAWIFRAVGLILCIVGCNLILGPLGALLSFIPFMGELTKSVTFFAASIFAIGISLVTIGLSWIAVRPLLGLALLVVAGLGFFAISKLRQSKPESTTSIDQFPPPLPNA